MYFRECLNEYGWIKKMNYDEEAFAADIDKNETLKYCIENKEFCVHNNAETAPEICNEFVTVYMEAKGRQWQFVKQQLPECGLQLPDLDRGEVIDLTMNICHWLFECHFTSSKLSLIP